MPDTANKVCSIAQIESLAAQWRNEGKKIVFTNGCFDLLHLGHIDYLEKAAALGDVLVVAVNADDSVKQLNKGPSRPLQNELSRSRIMAALACVSAVIIFSEPTPLQCILKIKPHVLVKGGDYSIEQVVGAKEVQSWGGIVTLIPFLEGYSTTAIENKIRG